MRGIKKSPPAGLNAATTALAILSLIVTAAPLAFVFGCSGFRTKVQKDVNTVTQGTQQAVQTINTVAAGVSTAAAALSQSSVQVAGSANAIINSGMTAMNTVEALSGTAGALQAQLRMATHYNNYTVVKGDTLWALSRRYYATGFLWPFLCQQNGVANCNRIKVGDNLRYAQADLMATYTAEQLEPYRQQAYAAK
jgi:LysM repeat protein